MESGVSGKHRVQAVRVSLLGLWPRSVRQGIATDPHRRSRLFSLQAGVRPQVLHIALDRAKVDLGSLRAILWMRNNKIVALCS